jgi:hypothetical protein
VIGGRTIAAGMWIAPSLVGDYEARRRVLESLDPGARVFAVDDGMLVLFGEPRVFDADEAPGSPVVANEHGGFTSCAFTNRELAETSFATGEWVRVHAGAVRRSALADLELLDPAGWIELESWTVEEVRPFGLPPQPTVVRVRGVPEDAEQSVRDVLGGKVPAAAPERAALMAALAGERTAPEATGWRGWFDRFFGGSQAGFPQLPSGVGAGGAGVPLALPPPPEPGFLARLFRGLVQRSALSRIIGRKQAQYLERTLSLFESGNLDEALRHAIPFASLPGAPSPPSLSVPSPRASLDLRAAAGPGASSSLNLGDDLYARFKALYRDAATRLESEGRIEEAAYVYFELLGDLDEGIAVLERHEKWALAASMAHGRGMNPGLVIRLWCLAKEPAKAVLVAKRTGAFADAIARLATQSPEDALRLRLIWADRLAQAGDYARAVQAVWPAEEARGLARAWVDRAIAYGGVAGARMLARKLSLWADDAVVEAQVAEAVATLVGREDSEAAGLRRALAEVWVEEFAAGSRVRPMLGALVRRLMLDGEALLVERLGTRGVDAVLHADIRRAKRSAPEHGTTVSHPRVFAPSDAGLLSPTDAVITPNGQLVLALGEAGLRVVDRSGRTVRGYRDPATTLVLADSGRRLITLHTRGERTTLTRVDLETGARSAWVETRLECWAPTYDGQTWYVAAEGRVLAIDVQEDGFDALWSVGGLPGRCIAVTVSDTHMRFATMGDASWVWNYELSSSGPVLRGKSEVSARGFEAFHLAPDGAVVSWVLAKGHNQVLASWQPATGARVTRQLSTPRAVCGTANGTTYSTLSEAGMIVHHLDAQNFSQAWALEFPGSNSVGVHAVGTQLVVFDGLGRIVLVDQHGNVSTVVRTMA